MGADMLLAVCRAPHSARDSRLRLDPATRDEAIARSQKYQPDSYDLDTWADPDSYEGYDWEGYEDMDEDDQHDLRVDAFRDRLLSSALAALRGSREITSITIDGKVYLASGGMSWGDPPTTAFDDLQILDDTGLFNEPFPIQLVAPSVVG